MDLVVLQWIVTGACGLVMYFMSRGHDATKEKINQLENNVGKALMKEDFKDFKVELFSRLDRLENDLKGK
jgi:hypothetical protein